MKTNDTTIYTEPKRCFKVLLQLSTVFSVTICASMDQNHGNIRHLNGGHKMQSLLHTYHIHLDWLDVVRLFA